ncbi:MAG: hypothetical protein JO172_10520, partial [Hyphomicrobiales bacterium]|nr:hypothetical protein [Hyphomicrobiales bacterium]
ELMGSAKEAARASPNRVRQVGAVLVTADGRRIVRCNDFPTGVRDLEERHQGDGRFVWMEHAERNAIFEAAKLGVATRAATLATTFFPCIDCARAIVQAGITRLCTRYRIMRTQSGANPSCARVSFSKKAGWRCISPTRTNLPSREQEAYSVQPIWRASD